MPNKPKCYFGCTVDEHQRETEIDIKQQDNQLNLIPDTSVSGTSVTADTTSPSKNLKRTYSAAFPETLHKRIIQQPHNTKKSSTRVPISKKQNGIRRQQQMCINILKEKIQKMKMKFKSQANQIVAAKKLSSSKLLNATLKNMPEAIQILTKMQFKYGKKPRGRRFTLEEKIMALSIYKQGPKVFKFLRKLFVLPSKRSLQKLLETVTFKPGINKHIFDDLKNIVKKMPQEKRKINLLFDEMALQPSLVYNDGFDEILGFEDSGEEKTMRIADHALVFMIKGIKGKTKQPICFTFCQSATKKETIKNLLIKIIRELREAGLTVVATICDQCNTNVSVINSLQEDTKNKYKREGTTFNSNSFEIDGIKVYPLFDPPHLLKGIRNNFLVKNVTFIQNGKQKTAKWEHLKMLFDVDEGEDEIRILNKLTEKHINKEKIPKMKVKYAALVFSERVSAVMRFLARRDILPSECEDTADFLLIFDKLFDSFNGHSYQEQSKKYKSCLKNHSPHFKLWADLLPILKSIKFQSIKKRNGVEVIKFQSVPSIKNWVHNINCMKEIFADLKNNHNIKNILPRNFNQDPLENFFSCIRSHGARNNNPTCAQFVNAFKTLIINNFNSSHSPGANCEKDDDQSMQSLKHLITNKHELCQSDDFACEIDPILDVVEDERDNEMSSLVHAESKKYVSGYVIKKCKSKISKNCPKCNSDMCRSEVDKSTFNYEVDYTKKSLYHPNDKMIKVMNDMYYSIVACLRRFPQSKSLKFKIKFFIDCACDFNMFNCDKHKDDLVDYMKNLATNIIVHTWCKGVNQILIGKFLKFDGNDSVKKQAFDYYNKRKKNKK